jgi:hypothetical protein
MDVREIVTGHLVEYREVRKTVAAIGWDWRYGVRFTFDDGETASFGPGSLMLVIGTVE